MDFSSSDEEEMARIEEEMRTPKSNPPSSSAAYTPTKGRILFGAGNQNWHVQKSQAPPSNFSRLSSRTIVPSSTSSSPPAPESATQSSTHAYNLPGSYSPSPDPDHSPTSPQHSSGPSASGNADPDATLLANSLPPNEATLIDDQIHTIAYQGPLSAQSVVAAQGFNALVELANQNGGLRVQLSAATTALAEKDAAITALREAKASKKRKIQQLREEIAEWDVDQLGIEELQFRHGFEREEMQAEIWRLENALADVSTEQTVVTTIEPEDHPSRGAVVLRWAGKVVLAILTVLLGVVLAMCVVGVVILVFRGETVSVKGEL